MLHVRAGASLSQFHDELVRFSSRTCDKEACATVRGGRATDVVSDAVLAAS
jgi:hypothetical protein